MHAFSSPTVPKEMHTPLFTPVLFSPKLTLFNAAFGKYALLGILVVTADINYLDLATYLPVNLYYDASLGWFSMSAEMARYLISITSSLCLTSASSIIFHYELRHVPSS